VEEHIYDFDDVGVSVGGSVGGTPHSGSPFGRCIRLGSQSSEAAALNRCTYIDQ
jgi:hypothetical protein